jgi:hypothetical protein
MLLGAVSASLRLRGELIRKTVSPQRRGGAELTQRRRSESKLKTLLQRSHAVAGDLQLGSLLVIQAHDDSTGEPRYPG